MCGKYRKEWDREWERERPKKRFRSCLDFQVLWTRLLDTPLSLNTSRGVGPSSLETPRQRLNSDPDIKRLDGIVVRRRHRTFNLPECSLCSARLLTSPGRFNKDVLQRCTQTVPKMLAQKDWENRWHQVQPSVGPATSRPRQPWPCAQDAFWEGHMSLRSL